MHINIDMTYENFTLGNLAPSTTYSSGFVQLANHHTPK